MQPLVPGVPTRETDAWQTEQETHYYFLYILAVQPVHERSETCKRQQRQETDSSCAHAQTVALDPLKASSGAFFGDIRLTKLSYIYGASVFTSLYSLLLRGTEFLTYKDPGTQTKMPWQVGNGSALRSCWRHLD